VIRQPRLVARAGVLVTVVALTTSALSLSIIPAARASGTPEHLINWLAAGDSYSSGEGLPHYTGPCVQALTGTGSQAWAEVAHHDLESRVPALEAPVFVACTGAKMDQFIDQADKAGTPEWDPATMARADLVTFTFGGDDVGFRPIVEQCLGIWYTYPTDPGLHNCPADSVVRSTIASQVRAKYPAFLDEVANKAMNSGGNIVVLGYPDLIEDPKFWPTMDRIFGVCMGIYADDAPLIRGWAGDLNATIGHSVASFNAEPAAQRNNVEATFVDVNTGQPDSPSHIAFDDQNLFEPSTGARHNICASESWLNGVSAIDGIGGSFHPKQQGQNAMGALAAEVIAHLNWSHLQGGVVDPSGRVGPLQIASSTESQVEKVAGTPQFIWTGNMISGDPTNQSLIPDFKAMGYDCIAPVPPNPEPRCQTTYYLDESTGVLQAFSTESSSFQTPNGTRVGMSGTGVQQRERQTWSTPGCRPPNIMLGSASTPTIVLVTEGGSGTVTGIASENTGQADPTAPMPMPPGGSGIGLLFC
jgi:hypothetical protein